jgi:lanosterol synthase
MWVEHADSQVVQTCWATMALMYARYPFAEPLEKAVKLVMSRQLPVRLATKKFFPLLPLD